MQTYVDLMVTCTGIYFFEPKLRFLPGGHLIHKHVHNMVTINKQ